jgi:rSAM/selenodomain-associated transferase 1
MALCLEAFWHGAANDHDMKTAGVAMRMSRSVLVFMKCPEPGMVKTRLATTVGAEPAATLYRQWISLVLGQLQPLRSTTRLVGYFDGGSLEAFRDWHALADDWWPQPTGDLGERLVAGFESGFDLGGPVLAVGTDCVEMEADLLLQAFEELLRQDVVFGPTLDGGYYLIGLSVARPELFRSIRWSSPFTLDDHLRCCREKGWSVFLLPRRHDIDTENDWRAYLLRSGRSGSSTADDFGSGDPNPE